MPTFNEQLDFPSGLSSITAIVQSGKTPAFRISPQVVDLSGGDQNVDVARTSDIVGIEFISHSDSTWTGGETRMVDLVMMGGNRDAVNVRVVHYINRGTPFHRNITFTLRITGTQVQLFNTQNYYNYLFDGKRTAGSYKLESMVILRKEPA